MLAVALLPVTFAFAFFAALIYWTGSPTFLVPLPLHERADTTATQSGGGVGSEIASPTGENEAASRIEEILDPDGRLDKAVIVVIAVVAGFVVGVLVVFAVVGFSTGGGLVAGILAWFGAGAYLTRRQTLNAAISKAAYSIAIGIISLSLLVFAPTWRANSTSTLSVDFASLAVLLAIPAAVVTGMGVLAGRYNPKPNPDG